jgi:hypothetical protein
MKTEVFLSLSDKMDLANASSSYSLNGTRRRKWKTCWSFILNDELALERAEMFIVETITMEMWKFYFPLGRK